MFNGPGSIPSGNSFSSQGRRSTLSRTSIKKNIARAKLEEDYFLDTIRAKGFAKVSWNFAAKNITFFRIKPLTSCENYAQWPSQRSLLN